MNNERLEEIREFLNQPDDVSKEAPVIALELLALELLAIVDELRGVLTKLTKEVLFYPEWLTDLADGQGCDAGNPDGGRSENCEHCDFITAVEDLTPVLSESLAMLSVYSTEDLVLFLARAH